MDTCLWILVICVIAFANGCTVTNTPQANNIIGENNQDTPPDTNHLVYSTCGASSNDLNSAFQKATTWLLSQRNQDWGWPFNSTATAILALQNTNSSWYSKGTSYLTAQLSVKQLEIELLAELSRVQIVDKNASKETRVLPNITPGNLAYYIMALNSTCFNVRNFYQNDLVEILETSMDHFPQPNFNNYFQYGLALLALCQSGATITTRYITEILDGQSEDGSYRYGTDVVSMALMAMVCIRHDVPEQNLTKFEEAIELSVNYILSTQNEYGIFGNPITTALATQALAATSTNWNCDNALHYVLNAQHEDGSFGSLGGTIQILPLLANKTFASVKEVDPKCQDLDTQGEQMDSSNVPEIDITLVIENGVDTSAQNLSLNVVVPENSTLFEAMVLARSQHNETFSFDANLGQWGHSISRINNVVKDGVRYYYWTILIGPERISASTGSDRIITEDQGVYIWYYKSFA